MKLSIVKGATSVLVRVFIQDATATDGSGLAGLTYASSGLTCYQMRDDDGNAAATAITLVTATRGTWTSGGFVEKDATNAPGFYEFGIPNAALATGSRSVDIHFQGATNMAPLPMEIELTGWNNQLVPGAAGGMFIAGTNAPVTITGAGNALTLTSTSAGRGIQITGSGAPGITVTGGSGTSGMLISGGSNSSALALAGNGTGAGLEINAGVTGVGIAVTTTAGDGVSITPTGGHALVLTANGTSKHGLFVTGGTAGTSDGIKAVAGTGGVDIRGAITGNITGNLSGSVNSVTLETTANVTKINSVATSSVTAVAANIGTAQPVNFTGTAGSALVKSDTVDIAGAAVSATTAQIGTNVVSINTVATTSVTTIAANQGTTQPVNFTGTAASALVKSDVIDLAGTAQTAGDIIPAIAGIGTAGGASINVDAATDNASGGITGVTSGTTKVGTQAGTFANLSFENGVYHVITHAANAIDWVYQFLIAGGTTPIGAVWAGYLTSANDTITFDAWNHVGGAWESIGTQVGQAGTTNVVKTLVLYPRHRGTSVAELGKVYIRLHCTGMTSPVLNSDQLYVTYAVTSRTVGYALGAVWLDTTGSNTATESYVDGTADNAVSTLAAARTIAGNLNLRKIHVAAGSTITLASTTSGFELFGNDWTLALGGQDISNTHIEGATVSGVGAGSGPSFHTCDLGNVTLPAGTEVFESYLRGTLIPAASGDYFFLHCGDGVAGAASAVFNFNSVVSVNLHLQNYSGGMDVANMVATDTLEWGGRGQLTIKSTCAGGSIIVRGLMDLIDQASGAVTVTDTARWNEDQNITNVTGNVTGNVGGNVTGSVGSVAGNVVGSVGSVASGGITASSIATNAIDADALSSDAVQEIVDAVWAEVIGSPVVAGSTGEALMAAGSAGDPWITNIPGGYTGTQAGKVVGDALDAAVSTRMASYVQPTGFLASTFPATVASPDNVWDHVIGSPVVAGSTGEALEAAGTAGDPWLTNLPGAYSGIQAGKLVGDALDAAVSSRAVAGDAMTLTGGERNSTADALLDRANGIETGATPRGAFRLMLAALAGKLSGAAGTTVTFRNAVADDKDRIVATVTADGNRTAVTTNQT